MVGHHLFMEDVIMAKADTATPAKPDVILTLTYDEASMLKRLLGNHVGGLGENREISDGIYNALKLFVSDSGDLPHEPGKSVVYLT